MQPFLEKIRVTAVWSDSDKKYKNNASEIIINCWVQRELHGRISIESFVSDNCWIRNKWERKIQKEEKKNTPQENLRELSN